MPDPCLTQIIEALKANQDELQISTSDFVGSIWQGLMAQVDWNARPDQLEGNIVRDVTASRFVSSCMLRF